MLNRFLTLLIYLLLFLVSLAGIALGGMNYLTQSRGVETDFPVTPKIIGTNVALEQYTSDADLDRALGTLTRARIHFARQYFPWREIEPQPGQYEWAKWDRIVNAAHAQGIQLVAVLYTAPAWSQRENERDLPGAPPNDFAVYTRFVTDFAKRYGDSIDYYQIWDEENVEPNWGRRNADPVEYAQMLIPAAQAIRANDAHAQILLGGLAMNLELHRPHPNYSEILYLRGLYEIGANQYFDLVAAKPYGMWTGPEDRTVSSAVLNFSRLILLRDEMRQYGDKAKPIWAVEMGWNALPAEWNGAASPWGTDTDAVQADRLLRGLTRAETEWNWLTGLFPLYLQPNVSPDDPRWGFSLLTRDGEPREFYNTLAQLIQNDPPAAAGAATPNVPWLPLGLLIGVALVAAWRLEVNAYELWLDERWRALKNWVNALPGVVPFAVIVATAAAFYFSPNTLLNFVLLGGLVFWFALRLDLGIALTIFAIPFWNYPKVLFGTFELAPAEVFTWAAVSAWLLNWVLLDLPKARVQDLKSTFQKFSALDWAVLLLLALALASTRWAGNFGVASREFRVVVLDAVLLYGLVRMTGDGRRTTDDSYQSTSVPRPPFPVVRCLYLNALLASGIAVCAIGFYQLARGDAILVDGVARINAVWGSPNNVALYLGRLLPIVLSFTLLLRRVWARGVYFLLTVLFAVTIFLTYSRGALFLGVPASVLFLLIVLYVQSHHLSRWAWVAIVIAIGSGIVALLPLLTTERFQNLFQTGTGTGFFRIAVWMSAVRMIRDHPILGVGLDNFLYEYPKYILPEAWREPNLSHPHNVILDFWVRLGIGGVVLLVWMLVAFFHRAWNVFTRTGDVFTRALMLGLMASMVDFLAHGSIDAAFFVIDLGYVFMLTLALAQTPISENE